MKAYEVKSGSRTLEGLVRVERAEPTPASGQIQVRMRAAALNFRDQLVIAGGYFGGTVARDTIPLSDGAGEVTALGPGVTRFRVGDRVAGTFFQGWIDGPPKPGGQLALGVPLDGVLAESVVLSEEGAVAIPPSLSFEEAATLPCAAVTAWHALMIACQVQPGHTVLVLGTGGVSLFALQLAKAAGARVLITSSSDEKLERARALGAHAGINYLRSSEWGAEVLKLTAQRGVDHVIEVGGAGTLARSMQSVALAGHIALIGVLSGREGDTSPHPIMRKGASMHGIFVGNRAMFERLNLAIEANGIKPVVDKVFAFDEAAEAYRYQQSGALFGKVVIRI